MSATDKSPVSFQSRIIASIKLFSLQFLSRIGLRLISTVVLTRLLVPEIYGVFAVVLVYRYILEMLSDLGVRSVILTYEGELNKRFLHVCWTVSILRGVVILAFSGLIGLVIFWLQQTGSFAPDSAYNSGALPLAITALGLASLVAGLISMNLYATERDMKFGQVTIGRIASNVVGLIVTIALAYVFRSVWALVIGTMAQVLVLVVHSHFAFAGPRMRLGWDREVISVIIARGKWIIGHSSLTAACQAADRLVLGFVVASATFGFYYVARQLMEMVNTFLGSMHSQMGIQVFTHIMKTPETFQKNYYRYRLLFDLIACLSAGGLFVLAPTLVDIIFNDNFADVAPILQILIFALPLRGPLTLREAYTAERKFREMTLLSVVTAVTLWVGLLLATLVFDSFIGALWVIALYRLPEALLLYVGAWRRGWLVWWRELAIPTIFGIGMALGWVADIGLVALAASLGL